MRYLSRDEVLELHAYILERFGGRMGVASQDRLLNAVEAPQRTMFNADLYPDLPSKAAALAYHLTRGRPFRSGNEATAMLATLRLLELNGAQLSSADALANRLLAVSRSRLGREELEEWVRAQMA